MEYRIDKDSMGEIKVPKNAHYGPQTQRSLTYFNIGHERMPMELIKAYALIKEVSAEVNTELGLLSKEHKNLIVDACKEILEGKLDSEFPLHVWQTGSGTQTNMNLNEVIASRANTLAGKPIGARSPIHPNDHVNCSQSTNDSFPTAMHVATVFMVKQKLLPSLLELGKTFRAKEKDFAHLIKMGRTHLQDATPVTLGQEMGGYAYQLEQASCAISENLKGVYELALGGTAVGTGLNTHPEFATRIAKRLSEKTGFPFKSAPNKFAALAAHDALVLLSGALTMLAAAFMKIANDIRWLSSGPRGGLSEIFIAENEPGSSIMPGKINPTQAEAATMVCCQVMGNHTTISIAGSQGNFELNVFKPVIIYDLLQSIRLLADSLRTFNEYCAISIRPNTKQLEALKNRSLMLVTALVPYIGYEQAAMVAKKAQQNEQTLREVVLELGLMTAEEFDERVKPEDMIGPNL